MARWLSPALADAVTSHPVVQSLWRWAGLPLEDSQISSISLRKSRLQESKSMVYLETLFLFVQAPQAPRPRRAVGRSRKLGPESHATWKQTPKPQPLCHLAPPQLSALLTREETPPKVPLSLLGRILAGKMIHGLPVPLTFPETLGPSLGRPSLP